MSWPERVGVAYVHTNRLPVSKDLAAYHSPSYQTMDSAAEILGRHRYILLGEEFKFSFDKTATSSRVRAPAADVDRWMAATRALVERVAEISGQQHRALVRLDPMTAGLWRRILWTIRHARGPARMRREYLATRDRLYGEMAAAYRAYDEQASDLADHIHADAERKRLEEQARHRQERREREERIAAVGGPEDAVWACHVSERSGSRQFVIWLPAIDDGPFGGGERPLLNATAREVQAEISRERAKNPDTAVIWNRNTAEAMRERRRGRFGDEATTWKDLTGERVEQFPPGPDDGRRSGRTGAYGPSSTYGSDHGGGGYSGGFSGSF